MWRSAVQLRAGLRYGGIAQLVEHLLCKQRVKSSNLFISTKKKHLQKCRCFFYFMLIRHIFYSSPPDGPFFVMFWSRKHIQLGNSAPMSFRHLRSGPSPFPASCYAELVSGGRLPTIAGAHISAPAGPCILRQQNMERQVGRQG